MMLEDDFVRRTFGEASKPFEWSLRVGLAALIISIGLILSRRSEQARDSRATR